MSEWSLNHACVIQSTMYNILKNVYPKLCLEADDLYKCLILAKTTNNNLALFKTKNEKYYLFSKGTLSCETVKKELQTICDRYIILDSLKSNLSLSKNHEDT